jgi:4-carboxymuconolactone decarboxylase
MRSRIPLPDVDGLRPEQRRIYDSIKGTRGNLNGPFLAWMHSPELASHAEKLGAFCRYGSSLSLQESELLILCVAAHHQCIGEQQIHEPIARQSGLPAGAVDDIREGRAPVLDDARLHTLYLVAQQLLATHRIGEDLFTNARAMFGDTSLVEAVGILGYYALVALTLNAFEMKME